MPPAAPSSTVQLTVVSLAPVTVAVNCCVPPSSSVALVSLRVMVSESPAETTTVAMPPREGSAWLEASTW